MSFKTPTFKAQSLTAHHKSNRVVLPSFLVADTYSLFLTPKELNKKKKKTKQLQHHKVWVLYLCMYNSFRVKDFKSF